jgi:hypothetical protein
MVKELAKDFLIKLKDYVKFSKLIVLQEIIENSFLKLIKYFTKRVVYAI